MTSKIKVDNINKVSDDTTIIKKCGSTTTVGSGSGNTIVVDGSAITLGRCGGTVALASGATQTGFGRTGTVDWQTTIKTGDFTAVNGEGYFINTTSGAITMTLPASPTVGSIVSFKDYARTFNSNSLSVGRNGSNMDGDAADTTFDTAGLSATLIFMDSTKGWSLINDDATQQTGVSFLSATGGTITEDGNFKVHTFTGPGTFAVQGTSSSAPLNKVDYLILAGGGGGGKSGASGAGAGGYRETNGTSTGCYSISPIGASLTALTVAACTSYPVVVGAGGTGMPAPGGACSSTNGGTSTFNSQSSAGGGKGKNGNAAGIAGGSGGGGAGGVPPGTGNPHPGGAGNTPPTSPPQGNTGGAGFDGIVVNTQGGGGGGAGAVGGNASSAVGGNGGNGTASSITGASVTRAGGGGGSADNGGNPGGTGGTGGTGGGGNAAPVYPGSGSSGTANTGGGGGAGSGGGSATGGSGGSGIVIIRYKFQ